MTQREAWLEGVAASGGSVREAGGVRVPARFTAVAEEYAKASRDVALCDRTHRGLLRVTGRDRASWLHNLVTNQVKPLSPRDGNYAFALNVKGRILFDLNFFIRAEDILLDLDRRFLPTALAHLNQYIIMEDVALQDMTPEVARIGVVGPRAGEVVSKAGWPQAGNAALFQWGPMAVGGGETVGWRSDFCGLWGYEVTFPVGSWNEAVRGLESHLPGNKPAWIGQDAVDVLRIERGVPCPLSEINDDILPAETGQLARAVSFNKGCYLGQEIVERMHARRVLARVLTGLVFDEGEPPPPGSDVLDIANQTTGKVTSSCQSLALGRPIALALVKTSAAAGETSLICLEGQTRRPCMRSPLPFVT